MISFSIFYKGYFGLLSPSALFFMNDSSQLVDSMLQLTSEQDKSCRFSWNPSQPRHLSTRNLPGYVCDAYPRVLYMPHTLPLPD